MTRRQARATLAFLATFALGMTLGEADRIRIKLEPSLTADVLGRHAHLGTALLLTAAQVVAAWVLLMLLIALVVKALEPKHD